MMQEVEARLGKDNMSVLSNLVNMIFGPEVYCDHGLKGSDGVCKDCCNDLYAPTEDEAYEAAVIDFSKYRDTI